MLVGIAVLGTVSWFCKVLSIGNLWSRAWDLRQFLRHEIERCKEYSAVCYHLLLGWWQIPHGLGIEECSLWRIFWFFGGISVDQFMIVIF